MPETLSEGVVTTMNYPTEIAPLVTTANWSVNFKPRYRMFCVHKELVFSRTGSY